MERLDALRGVRELAGLRNGELRALLPYFDEVCVPPGAVVAQEGLGCHELVIVAAGELHVRGRQAPGRLGPGDSFGWEAMRRRGRSDATVTAATGARLLVMSHAQFRAMAALEIPA